MNAIPRYRSFGGPALFSAGFRPFFLGSAIWAALAVPLWLALYRGLFALPTALAPTVWHAHELIYGYGAATVAGFLLTAIPNWTGRMPLQGAPLIALFAAWFAGRIAILLSGVLGPWAAAVVDLAFPAAFTLAVAREIVVGRNWHNLAVVFGLALIGMGNALVHLEAVGLAQTADLGNRLGIAILVNLIAVIGGRIVPSFTGNWLRKTKPEASMPAPSGIVDKVALAVIATGVVWWAFVPDGAVTSIGLMAAGVAAGVRLMRWRGFATLAEPLLFVLHVGYAWLAVGLVVFGANGLYPLVLPSAGLHALTAGAIGTMTLAVMTRASLGHTGHELKASGGTTAIYVLVNAAAALRILAPSLSDHGDAAMTLSGATWAAAFLLFAVLYGPLLLRPRA